MFRWGPGPAARTRTDTVASQSQATRNTGKKVRRHHASCDGYRHRDVPETLTDNQPSRPTHRPGARYHELAGPGHAEDAGQPNVSKN
jgi:hypothetical protein